MINEERKTACHTLTFGSKTWQRYGGQTMLLRLLLCAAFLIPHFSLLISHSSFLIQHSTFFICPAYGQGAPIIRNFPATEYKAHNMNFDVIMGDDGTVYFANFEGLLYYDNAEWRIIHTPGVSRITAVFRDQKGTIWTGGYNYIGYVESDEQGCLRLHSLHDSSQQQTFQGEVQWIWEREGHIFFKVSDDKIYTIQNDNVLWAAGEKLPTTGFSVFVDQTHITQVQELEDGLKAVSTNGNGIIVMDANDKELFRLTEDNGLCSNNVNHITYNKHGLIWGATDSGVFAVAFPSIYTHYTQHQGLRGGVLSIEKLGNDLFVGTIRGLFVKKGIQFEPVKDVKYGCWQLARQGNSLLAATSNGVYRISPGPNVKHLNTDNTLSLLVDEGGYYSGEADGVYYNTGAIHKKVSDLEKVVKIRRDSQGTIWMQNLYGKIWRNFAPYTDKKEPEASATLVEYNGQVLPINTFTTKPFPYPTFSYTDPEGVTWLTNPKARHLYAFKDGNVQTKLSHDVYPLMELSVRTMLRDDRLLWIGSDKGLNVVYYTRQEPSEAPHKPRLLLRSVLLHGDSVLWGGYGEQITQLPTLNSDDHRLTFNFSIDYPSLTLKTQYRNRINGGKWSAWDTDTFEEFNNLTHGSYTLEIQARDAFGKLSDIVTVQFDIRAPFYLRWYMIVFYLLLLMLAAYLIMQWRTIQLEKDKHRLERLVQQRTKQVVRLEKQASVGKLTQGLIDRILNPLNYINNFAKLSEGLVKDVTANIEDEKEHMDPDNYEDTLDVLDMLKGNLQKVGEHGANTTRTLKAMEEMLKDRSGGISQMNLTTLLHQNEEMVRKYFENEISQYHIKTIFELPQNDILINGNAEQLNKTFMNLLTNAIYALVKKAQRGQAYDPEISLTTEMSNKHILLHFRDNGIGIESTIMDKIFDPFFTTKTTGEASGVGLYLGREIIQNHGGDISVQSEKDVYTEFTITLPVI